MMKQSLYILVGLAVLLGQWDNVLAKKAVVNVPSTVLTTRTDAVEEMGNYYLLAISIPREVQRHSIYGASLEFYVDASVTEEAQGHDPAPLIQVFALNTELGPSFSMEAVDKGPGAVGVPIGSSRRVKVDVTETIRGWLAEPSRNYGLIIGSLSGAQAGRFSIRDDNLGAGIAARLVVHYEP